MSAQPASELPTLWRLVDCLQDFQTALALAPASAGADCKQRELELLCAAAALLGPAGSQASAAGFLHSVSMAQQPAVSLKNALDVLRMQSLVMQLGAALQLSTTPAEVPTATAEIEFLTEALHDLLLDINYLSPQASARPSSLPTKIHLLRPAPVQAQLAFLTFCSSNQRPGDEQVRQRLAAFQVGTLHRLLQNTDESLCH